MFYCIGFTTIAMSNSPIIHHDYRHIHKYYPFISNNQFLNHQIHIFFTTSNHSPVFSSPKPPWFTNKPSLPASWPAGSSSDHRSSRLGPRFDQKPGGKPPVADHFPGAFGTPGVFFLFNIDVEPMYR